jgi:hypothetical protein
MGKKEIRCGGEATPVDADHAAAENILGWKVD